MMVADIVLMGMMMIITVVNNKKGGVVMAVSRKLAQLYRDATAGMTDNEVMESTGLKFATWQRMKGGMVTSDERILEFCSGLGLDPNPFIEAATEARPQADPAKLLGKVLTMAGLTPNRRMQVISLYRELIEEQQSDRSENAA